MIKSPLDNIAGELGTESPDMSSSNGLEAANALAQQWWVQFEEHHDDGDCLSSGIRLTGPSSSSVLNSALARPETRVRENSLEYPNLSIKMTSTPETKKTDNTTHKNRSTTKVFLLCGSGIVFFTLFAALLYAQYRQNNKKNRNEGVREHDDKDHNSKKHRHKKHRHKKHHHHKKKKHKGDKSNIQMKIDALEFSNPIRDSRDSLPASTTTKNEKKKWACKVDESFNIIYVNQHTQEQTYNRPRNFTDDML